MGKPHQHTLSSHPINSPCQPTLSTHPQPMPFHNYTSLPQVPSTAKGASGIADVHQVSRRAAENAYFR